MVKNLYNALDSSSEDTAWIKRKPRPKTPAVTSPPPAVQTNTRNERTTPVKINSSPKTPSPPVVSMSTNNSSAAAPPNPSAEASRPSRFMTNIQRKIESRSRSLDTSINENFGSDKVNEQLRRLIGANKNRILVIGVGGGGSNAVNRLEMTGIEGAVTVAANTDAYHLLDIHTQQKLILGLDLTDGNGAGNDPVIGRAAAEETLDDIRALVEGADMVFITTGLGGGTGTGAAPVIAQVAKECGALVVGVCTLPFEMEGDVRIANAFEGLKNFYESCDTVIVIPNEKLLKIAPDIPVELAFEVVDEVLIRAVRGIISLVIQPALVNVDFADIRTILKRKGTSVIGLGEASGPNRVEEALNESLAHNLLEARITGCKAALIHITGGSDLVLEEIKQAVKNISDEVGSTTEIIWGTHIDPDMKDIVQVTTILSGVESPYSLPSEGNDGNIGEDLTGVQFASIWGSTFR